jgi:hypothetical protein
MCPNSLPNIRRLDIGVSAAPRDPPSAPFKARDDVGRLKPPDAVAAFVRWAYAEGHKRHAEIEKQGFMIIVKGHGACSCFVLMESRAVRLEYSFVWPRLTGLSLAPIS